MRKPAKQYRRNHSNPVEWILQAILILALLFFVYQAIGYIFARGSLFSLAQNSTKVVSTLVATINFPVTGVPTSAASPTVAGASPTPPPLATSTPQGSYLLPAKNYIPDVTAQLGNYSLESEQAMDITPMRGNAWQAHYTNSYPLYHDSDDAYSASYIVYVFSEKSATLDFYDAYTMDSLISIYESTYNQRIYPTPIDREVENVDATRIYCFNFTGALKSEIHCQVLLRDDNLVGQVTIKLFNTGSSATKAISQAKFFSDLLINNLK